MKLGPLWDAALDAHTPETVAFNAKLPKEQTPARWTPEAIAKARDLSQIMGGVFATKSIAGFEERTIPGPAGPIRLRTYVPPEVRAVYLDIHGGGFFMGAPEMDDAGNAALAKHAHVATVATSYRLAPEHPYPAGPDDCEAAALWLLANAQREFGVDRSGGFGALPTGSGGSVLLEGQEAVTVAGRVSGSGGDITIRGGTLAANGWVHSWPGGTITIEGESLAIRNGGKISAETGGSGDTGTIAIRITGTLLLDGGPQRYAAIQMSRSGGSAAPGRIDIEGPEGWLPAWGPASAQPFASLALASTRCR